MCDYVYVLRHGKHVEQGSTRAVLLEPQAKYSRELMASVPRIDKRLDRFDVPTTGKKSENSAALQYFHDKGRDQKTTDVPLLQVKTYQKLLLHLELCLNHAGNFKLSKKSVLTCVKGKRLELSGNQVLGNPLLDA